jgi:hypothetical protein
VTDAYGNPVADNALVSFTVTPAGNGARVTFANGGQATTTNGVATITATANRIAGGPYTVTATCSGKTATFTLTNTPGPSQTMQPDANTTAAGGVNMAVTVGGETATMVGTHMEA